MKTKPCGALATAGLICFLPFRADAAVQYYQAAETKDVVVNGRLDETVWQAAEWVDGFRLLKTGGRPTQATEFAVLFDQTNLYVGVKCHEEKMDALRENIRADKIDIWQDDCIEVFLAAGADRYDHFMANSAGAKYAETRSVEGGCPCAGRWQVGITKGKKQWSAELRIPLVMINPTNNGNPLWGFNVCRSRYVLSGPEEFSSWSWRLGGDGFLDRKAFGSLLFAAGGFTRHLEPQIVALRKKVQEARRLLDNCPSAIASRYQGDIARVDSQAAEIEAALRNARRFTADEMSALAQRQANLSQLLDRTANYIRVELALQ